MTTTTPPQPAVAPHAPADLPAGGPRRLLARATEILVLLVALFMLVQAVRFVRAYGTNVPYQDDASNLPYVLGTEPLARDLFAQHNEHRIPLPRLLSVAVIRLAGDFRAAMYLNVALLAATTAVALALLRRLRGRLGWTDAFVPLCAFSLGHYVNLIWGFQTVFFVSVLCWTGALAAVAWTPGPPSPRRVALLALCLLGLVGSGGILVVVPPLLAWLAACAAVRWRACPTAPRTARLACALAAATVVVALALYFTNYTPTPRTGTTTLPAIVETARSSLALAFSPVVRDRWEWWSNLTLSLLAGAGIVLLVTAWRRPSDRARAAGILAVLAGGAIMAVGIGVSRSHFGAGFGLAPRYTTLFLPVLLAAYVAFAIYGGRLLRTAVPAAMLFALAWLMPPTVAEARAYAADLRNRIRAYETDLRHGIPLPAIASRHAVTLFPFDPDHLMVITRQLHDHRLGPYRDGDLPPPTADLPPTAPVDLPLEPTATHQLDWRDGQGRGLGPDPFLVWELDRPARVLGLRFDFVLDDVGDGADLQVWWARNGRIASANRWILPSPSTQSQTVWMFATVDTLRIDPALEPCFFKLEKVTLLLDPHDPAARAGAVGVQSPAAGRAHVGPLDPTPGSNR